jgi:hypothetical protein
MAMVIGPEFDERQNNWRINSAPATSLRRAATTSFRRF